MEDAKSIIERCTPHAYTVAFRLTGNQTEAWDLVQNAMLRVIKSFKTYDPSYKPEQWLHRIVRNLYIDRLRRVRRRKEDPLVRETEDGRLSHADVLPDPAPGPEDTAECNNRVEVVQQALAKLPEDLRMAITLVDIEHNSYEEASQILEIPVSTLGVRVFRARKILKQHLKPYLEGKI